MSHISDAQHLVSVGMAEDAIQHMNFAKLLVMKYNNTDVYVTEDDLDELWEKVERR